VKTSWLGGWSLNGPDTHEEALEHAQEAIKGFLEALKLEGLPLQLADVEVVEVTVKLPDQKCNF